jgi:hypothetical protein
MVHFGHADQVLARRQETLHAAYHAHPERFVRRLPRPLTPPSAVWINPPSPDRTCSNREEEPVTTKTPTHLH